MAATQFQPVTWGTDPVTAIKLKAMANNEQWLFENMPFIRYTANGITKNTGVKIIGGKSVFPATGTPQAVVTINFGTFFTPGCKPSVVFSIQGTNGLHQGLQGVTQAAAGRGEIDHTGFLAVISIREAGRNITQSGWIHWHAIGY